MLRFTSDEPKVGDPPWNWENFQRPQLRRLPDSSSISEWKHAIGFGEDGLVVRAQTSDGADVAVKIFYHSEPPPAGFFQGYRYWPFERECYNCALLEMITASLSHAALNGTLRYVHPSPATRREASRNLRAFSAEYIDRPKPEHFVPFTPRNRANPCLGWTEFDAPDLKPILKRLRAPGPSLEHDGSYFAIVYPFVPEGTLDHAIVQTQLDFFYLTGFVSVLFKEDNWRGSGILVDLSDIVPPHAPEWDRVKYGKLVRKFNGMYGLENSNPTTRIGKNRA